MSGSIILRALLSIELSYESKKTPEGVYVEFVGVSKNYVEWHWKVEKYINNRCVQERRRCSVKYTRR